MRPAVLITAFLALTSQAGADQKTFSLPGVGPDPSEANVVGTLYGIPNLCASYSDNSDFFAKPSNGDGIWWMDDKRLVGHEIYCDIESKLKTEIKLLCHYEADETGKQTSQFQIGNGWVEIDGERLEECAKPVTSESAQSVSFEDSVKAWREANQVCATEKDASGNDISMDALKAACVALGVATTRLSAAGYCLNTEAMEWAYCKPTLPENAGGIWSGAANNGFIDLQKTGEFYYSATKNGKPVERTCHLESQFPGKWGYKVSCNDGTRGEMQFYEDGTMGFDDTLFTYGDCPNGCPE